MRVLHIYSGNLYGGVETALATLSRLIPLCPDLRQDFALCFEGRLSEEIRRFGSPVHLLGPARTSRPLTVRRARRRLRSLLRSEKFDVAICHSTWSQAIFGPAAQAENVPQVFWLHEPLQGRRWIELWARAHTPDLAITNSRFTFDTLRAVYPGTPAELLYFPVEPAAPRDSAPRTEVRRSLGADDRTSVIIQVSRMEAWKGQMCHLAALAELRDVPEWSCWMVGGPQRPSEKRYYDDLRRVAEEKGLSDRVTFLGDRTDARRLMSGADIYCQPNTAPETFGFTFVEAMYCGLPVVTSAIGAATEIVNRECGVLVSPNDPGAVARSLERLVRDKDLRSAMRQPARMRARELCDPGAQMVRLRQILAGLRERENGNRLGRD